MEAKTMPYDTIIYVPSLLIHSITQDEEAQKLKKLNAFQTWWHWIIYVNSSAAATIIKKILNK